ncbi:MAG: alpha-glucan family phosphorylase [Spirochaetota bacterium]
MLTRNIFVYPRYPDSMRKLFYLAYNLWSLWDAEAVQLFNRIDPLLFRRLDRNPVQFLHSIKEERIVELSRDEAFLGDLERIWERYIRYAEQFSDYQKKFKDRLIAYFSMEYGLHKSIPIYAGGLGILAGDHLKGASDLGIPILGIGLFYRYGFFDQRLNIEGVQEEEYTPNNIYYAPVKELKNTAGESIYVTVDILGKEVKAKVWVIDVGRIKLWLLDTNIDENPPEFRSITDYLYDARRDVRIMQELVLGCGGIKVLKAMKVKPDVYHLNEGHSAFIIIQRMRDLILDEKYTFDEAYALIKNTTVFTTHTPVEAGNENFPLEMVEKYLKTAIDDGRIPLKRMLDMGILHDAKVFWLPALAIRSSRYVNAVSRIHGDVSREMWKDLFPQRMKCEIPIMHITNGVHHSWISSQMAELFERYLGPDYISLGRSNDIARRIAEIPDEELWEVHTKGKRNMIAFLRTTLEESYAKKGYSMVKIRKVQDMLDSGFLTIGFARRFTFYKRPTLILKDKERLRDILKNPEKPVQLIFAGKAHPADTAGKNMIKEVVEYARDFELEDRVIFIENYDQSIAEHLVQGVDVWLNTPLKPFEASGTSGMKAGMNGVLNLSVLDGWWPECFNGKNGWAIKPSNSHENPELRDISEATQIYDLLEEEITDLFYDRNEREIPEGWVAMMKESIHTVLKDFTICRVLAEYCEKSYLPAVQCLDRLLKDDRAQIKDILKKAGEVRAFWDKIFIKDVSMNIDEKEVLFTDDKIHVDCLVFLDDADSKDFDVELFYFVEKDNSYETYPLSFSEKSGDKTARYSGDILLKSSGIQSLGVRLVPSDPEIRVLYPELIKWKEY